MEEVAYTFSFSLTEIKVMKVSELVRWHKGVARIQKKLSG
jgi:hypothetical protein